MADKTVMVIGHFGFGKNLLNGQTVKTKILTTALEEELGTQRVFKIDTSGGAKRLPDVVFQAFRAMCRCQNTVILPAHNGLRILAPILSFFSLLTKCRLHYVVIGGWLPKFLKKRKLLTSQLKRFAGVYVETSTMKNALEGMGFTNVFLMPNCKQLQQLNREDMVYPENEPYKLCTFSRVMKEKGIEDAVNAVQAVNEALGRTVYTLDIYGQVDSAQLQWFEKLQNTFPAYVRYGGLVPYDKSVEVLKDSFALLFPTRFFTEGIPGTIIDAYAAGVPVISAKWESFGDVIVEGVTGYGYAFEDVGGLRQQLLLIAEMPERITNLRMNCLKHAVAYTPNKAMDVLIKRIGG